MGKSNSCLKIIACGSDSADKNDDTHTSEAKGEGDKRGWSFRKRSRHRVLSNSVVSEVHTSRNKETLEAVNVNYQDQNATISEKVASLHKPDDKPQSPISLESKVLGEKPQLPISDDSKAVDEKPQFSISTESKISDEKNGVSRSVETDIKSGVKPEIPRSVESKMSKEESQILTPVEAKMSDEKPYTPYSVDPNVSDEKPETLKSADPKITYKKPELPTAAESKLPEPVVSAANVSNTSDLLDESDAITIQTYVRNNLAQRELAKLKSIVKLQAYARGHLVRMHAAQTLHCIKAIVKVQGLVRARQSRLLGKQTSTTKSTPKSTEKLLRNSFARQLLESTPKPKFMTIKGDPSRSNSTWNWFELWMSASSSEIHELQKQELSSEPEEGIQAGLVGAAKTEEISSQVMAESMDSKANISEEIKFVEHDSEQLDSSTYDSEYSSQLLAHRGVEQPFPKNNETPEELFPADTEMLPSQKVQTNSHFQKECSDLPERLAVESEPPKRSSKRLASEVLDAQGKKSVNGSKKATNPAFVAAKSKFRELSSAANSGRSASLSKQDSGAKPDADTVSSAADVIKSRELNPAAPTSADEILKTKEPSPEPCPTVLSTAENTIKIDEPRPTEIPASYDSRAHIAVSECGTELSISSTLDSPDRSVVETAELDCEVKHVEGKAGDTISTKSSDAKINGVSNNCISNLPSWPSVHPEEAHASNDKLDITIMDQDLLEEEQKAEEDACDAQTNNDCVKPVMATKDSHLQQKAERSSDVESNGNHVDPDTSAEHQETKKKPEKSACDAQVVQSPQLEPHTYKSSPDASPNSHMTVPESQGTPSSQVSVKTKRNRSDKSGSKTKRSSLSASKKSPHSNQDSGVRSSVEKDQKGGKRRNSFGSAKSDNIDQEPRDSSCGSKTLPSYMQATESARMKANSPRSSPDVHDKDPYVKKRHSLPGAGGRQVSPGIQRSNSQTPPQGAKGNDRRWQR